MGAGCLSNDHGAVGDGALGALCDCPCDCVGKIVSDPMSLLLSVAEPLEVGKGSVTDVSVAVFVSVADEAGSPEAEAAVEMGTTDKGGAMVEVLGEIGPAQRIAVVTRRPVIGVTKPWR